MKFNYNLILSEFKFQRKSPTEHLLRKGQKTNVPKPFMMLFIILCGILNSNGQSTLISPTGDGGFNNGSSFTANGWSVANEGTNPSKWHVGTAGAMTGNAAYVSNDGGLSNTCAGYGGNRTLYFYREVTVPAAESAITLTFDVKSPYATTNGWQVWIAPTSQTVVGTDTQVTTAFNYSAAWTGATLISFNNAAQTASTNVTAFIPARFAGTTFKLIFAWTNNSAAFTLAPAAIDNISLVSRKPIAGFDEIEFKDLVIKSAKTGNWSSPSTWEEGIVPTPVDDVEIQANHTVSIDSKFTGAHNLVIAGVNAILNWATNSVLDEFIVSNDLKVSGTGALFNVSDGTSGKRLKVGGNIDIALSGRLDVSIGSTTLYAGALELNGSGVQKIIADGASSFGGTIAAPNSTNKRGVINQLIVTNTSTTTPNINWNVDGVRIASKLNLVSGRVGLNLNKDNQPANNTIIIGNYSYSTSTETYVPGNGFIGGTVSRWLSGTYAGGAVPPGVDYPWGINTNYSFYQILDSKGNNRWTSIYQDAAPATGGEVAIKYVDSNTVTVLSSAVTDDSYTINNRYEGNWTVTTPNSNGSGSGAAIVFTPHATINTFRFAAYATGGYDAKDGSSHFMNFDTALAGTHQDGTTTPFVFRKGLTIDNLKAAPIYIGLGTASIVNKNTAIESTNTGGDWSATTTWKGGIVPTACDNVIIADKTTVTIAGAVVAGNLTINTGGTLISNSGSLTVGCSGNNSVFNNLGTYTCNGGTLTVNGSVAHRAGSFFNHTGGDIIVDGNDDGKVATSVGYGGSIFKIETSKLNLTGGKITIVDPLVNDSPATTTAATTVSFTSTTAGATGTFDGIVRDAATKGSSTIIMKHNSAASIFYAVNQFVYGTGIASGTFIKFAVSPQAGNIITTITLSSPLTEDIAAGSTLQFSSMSNGCNKIILAPSASNADLAQWLGVSSGTAIPAGTIIRENPATDGSGAGSPYVITLSNAVTGLTTSPITSPQTITVNSVTPGSIATILTAANSKITVGQVISGEGIAAGTTVASYSAGSTALTLSQPIMAGAPSPLSLTFSDSNANGTGAFIYDSPNHYAAGLGHTLQIGDGVSTQKGTNVTQGFNCIFQKLGTGTGGAGMLSLGNLILNAPDGTNRFMNVQSVIGQNNGYNMSVQGDFTIASGSVFKKWGAPATIYLGGNLTNNGSFITGSSSITLNLANFINGTGVATSLPQTISGDGTFASTMWSTQGGPVTDIPTLIVNNSNQAGVTLNRDFNPYSLTLTNGIIHTSSTNLLSVGNPDTTSSASVSQSINGGTTTSFIDGPVQYTFLPSSSFTDAQFKSLPIGKGSVYSPIAIAATPAATGAKFIAEAFTTNTGSAPSGYKLGTKRWKVTIGSGNISTYNVKVGAVGLVAPCAVVQAADDQGAYNLISGTTPVYTSAPDGAPFGDTSKTVAYMPTLTLTPVQAVDTFTGNFAYAEGPSCAGTPTPGNTIASSASVCNGQSTTLSLQNATVGTNVTYQWQSSTTGGAPYTDIEGATAATYVATPIVNTTYICNVTCSGGTAVASNATTITMSNTDTPTVTPAIGCGEPANLSASGVGTLIWYDAATAGNIVATGPTYEANATATYYVASRATSTSSNGQINLAAATSASLTANFTGLAFNTTKKITLTSVKVYPKNTAVTPITIRLYNSAGVQVPGTADVTFTPKTNTDIALDAAPQVVNLGYEVPVGTGYRLVTISGMSTANTLAKSTAVQTYPAPFNALTITGNVTDLSSAVATTANNYNCFFDIQANDYCESARVPVTATVHELPTVSASASQVCAGGSITLSPTTGGTWTSSDTAKATVTDAGVVTTIAAGDVTFTFTDSTTTCSATTSTVTIKALPTVSVSASQVCLGSSITLSPSTGGTWISNDTAKATVTDAGVVTTIATGDVTFTFTDSTTTCSATTSTVTINALPTVSAESQVCLGSSITLSPISGGTWISNDTAKATVTNAGVVTTIATGDVTFTFTDSVTGCDATTSTVTINALPTVSAASQVCLGSSITLSPISGGTWVSNDTAKATVTNAGVVTTIATGDVTFTFTDSVTGCDATTSAVSVIALPTVDPITGTTAIDINQTVTLSSTTSGGTWSSDNTGVATVNATTGEVTGVSQGTATISYTVTNNNCSASATTVVTVSSLANSKFDINNLKYYPNPVTDVLNISYTNEITSVTLYNLLGQEVLNKAINATSATLDLSNLPSGSYMVRINAEAMVKTIKVVKQ